MLKARYTKYTLDFNFKARTSRGAMWHKPTFFIEVWDDAAPWVRGLGECNHFPGLSPESQEDFEAALNAACISGIQETAHMPGLIFGLECALAQLRQGGRDTIFPSEWTSGKEALQLTALCGWATSNLC